jgi:protein phosphatase 2C family protein 2/3
MQKKPNQKQTKFEYSSDFIRAYLHARRRSKTSCVEVVVVKDQSGCPVCYGAPCEWPAGIAAHVITQDYKVEVEKYYSKEEQKQSDEVLIEMESKDELELDHPKLQKSSQSEADLKFMRTVCYGVAAEKGVRTHMEDEHIIVKEYDLMVPKKSKSSKNLSETLTGFMSYCGVYDGHRGREASQYCRERLHINIAQEIPQDNNVCEAIKRGCLQTDKEFLEKSKEEDLEAGAVLVVTVMHGKELYIANAGDCRAVLCRAGRAVELTQDHRPDRVLEEKLRVESLGGKLEFGCLDGDLEVSRAVGDRDPTTGEKLKGLTAEPEAHKLFITDDDEFLLLACDGLFEAFSSEDAIKIARRSLFLDNDVQKAANDLVTQALRRSEDNVTAIIIGFSRIAPDGSLYIVPSTEQELYQRKARDEPRTKKISSFAIATLLSEIEEAKVGSPCSSTSSSPCPSPLPSETASPHSSPSPASTPSPSRSSVSSLSSRGRVSSMDLSIQFNLFYTTGITSNVILFS